MSFDWATFTVSVLALGFSGLALRQNWKARMIAKEAEKSAAVSAAAATKSAEEAARLTRIEAARDLVANETLHRQLAPQHPGGIAATLEASDTGRLSLFGSITLTGTYRVQAWGVAGKSFTPITGLPLLLHAHRKYRLHIEHWPEGRETPQTTEILFRLWPPVPGVDETDPWACPCHRPTGQAMDGPGHWEIRVPIVPPVHPLAIFG